MLEEDGKPQQRDSKAAGGRRRTKAHPKVDVAAHRQEGRDDRFLKQVADVISAAEIAGLHVGVILPSQHAFVVDFECGAAHVETLDGDGRSFVSIRMGPNSLLTQVDGVSGFHASAVDAVRAVAVASSRIQEAKCEDMKVAAAAARPTEADVVAHLSRLGNRYDISSSIVVWAAYFHLAHQAHLKATGVHLRALCLAGDWEPWSDFELHLRKLISKQDIKRVVAKTLKMRSSIKARMQNPSTPS